MPSEKYFHLRLMVRHSRVNCASLVDDQLRCTEVSRAKAILEQMETAHADSRGAFGLSTGNEQEIEMIDEPMVKQVRLLPHFGISIDLRRLRQAQRILERARRAGTYDE